MRNADLLTTTETANICGVSSRTVQKWFDEGHLKGFLIPGSRDRRIPLGVLLRFMQEHGIPTHGLEDSATVKVLLASADKCLFDTLSLTMSAANGFKMVWAPSLFEAGLQAADFAPDVVLVDIGLGLAPAMEASRARRKRDPHFDLVLVAILPAETKNGFDRSDFNETFRRPFDAELLAARLVSMIGARRILPRPAAETEVAMLDRFRFWRGPGIKRLLTAHEERERTFESLATTLELLEATMLRQRESLDRGLAAIRRIKERESD